MVRNVNHVRPHDAPIRHAGRHPTSKTLLRVVAAGRGRGRRGRGLGHVRGQGLVEGAEELLEAAGVGGDGEAPAVALLLLAADALAGLEAVAAPAGAERWAVPLGPLVGRKGVALHDDLEQRLQHGDGGGDYDGAAFDHGPDDQVGCVVFFGEGVVDNMSGVLCGCLLLVWVQEGRRDVQEKSSLPMEGTRVVL